MDAKLKAYRIQGGYREQFQVPILQGLDKIANLNRVYYGNLYTNAQVIALDQSHGVIGYFLIGDIPGTNGQEQTYAVVLSINTAGQYFETGQWRWGNPVGNTVRLIYYNFLNPLLSDIETIDVSDLLLEDGIEVKRQIESEEKLDLRVSRASFSLNSSTSLDSFLGKYWNPDGYEYDEYLIGVELGGYFFGVSDFDNINYDEVERTYYFDAYDPIKWLQKNLWSLRPPSLGSTKRNLEGFLLAISPLFYAFGKTLNIDVDANQNFSTDYSYFSSDNVYLPISNNMTAQEMLIEMIKHYGASLYYDADGNLNFVTRNKTNDTSYDQSVMLEDLNKSFALHDYSALLINVEGEWNYNGSSWSQWEGWVLVWESFGQLQVSVINANLSNIPKQIKYLDLRQELPDFNFNYRMFNARTREEVYSDYKDLMRSSAIYDTTLNGVDYQLFDKLNINDEDYIINYLQIDFAERNTKIRCYKNL